MFTGGVALPDCDSASKETKTFAWMTVHKYTPDGKPRDMTAHVRLLRLGRRLAVGEVEITSDGSPDMVAHAIATYSLPSQR